LCSKANRSLRAKLCDSLATYCRYCSCAPAFGGKGLVRGASIADKLNVRLAQTQVKQILRRLAKISPWTLYVVTASTSIAASSGGRGWR
jgi:hypothetical protein